MEVEEPIGMWMNFILTMTAARLGWLSASGLVAVALLCIAVVRYASGEGGMNSLILSALINLAALSMDYKRNA